MRARRKPLILADTAVAVSSLLGLDDGEHNQRSSNHGLTFKAGLLFLPGLDISLDGDANSKCPPYPELPTEVKEILDQRCGSEFVDVTILVGLSASALRRLSLTSGSWVKLRDASTSSNRVAKVLVLDPPSVSIEGTLPLATCFFPYTILSSKGSPHVDPHTAYLSPQLAFNLGLQLSCLELLASCIARPNINPSCEKTSTIIDITPFVQSKSSLQDDKGKTTVFRYATHMRIAFIRIPVVRRIVSTHGLIAKQRQEDIDVALQSYFRETRILTKGDIFKVHLLLRSPDYVVTSVKDAEAIYFQVIDLEPSTELFLSVEYSHTALVLSGAVPSQIPPSMMKPSRPWLPSLHADAVYKLASLLAPCLHPKVAPLCLRTSVLLLGQAGCGKRMVTKHAADMLGIHVAEINCFDLVGSSEGKTVTALKQAFQVAQRYSPSVLLLRRFGAFKRAAASGNSLSENIGGLSRIASTLQNCICIGLGILEDDHMISETEEIGDSNMETHSVAKFSSNKKIPIAHGYKDGLVLVVAAAEDEDSVVLPLRRCFTHEIALGTPNENERLECLCHYIRFQKVDPNNSALIEDDCLSLLKSIASQTSGFTPRDLRGLAADAGAFAISRDLLTQKTQATKTAIIEAEEARCHGKAGMANEVIGEAKTRALEVRPEDIKKAFDCAKLRTASAIGTPKVPNVKWEDVGGLEDVKKAILDTVQLPLLHRELFASGLKQRAGVLLYGPPGTGKTLLAKAVATECSLNFMSVKGPELINMYIGESEKNVREIFQKARAARPCVVFFDELDALAPARGASGDSGGVMDRVVSQMLAEIDGLSANTQDLFIIGASNRPDLIDPALLRPGRFDKLLYVGITSDPLHKQRVLEALTRKFTLDSAVSLEDLARRCPVNFTGADMYALCADSWTHAVKRKVSEDNGDMDVAEKNDDIVVVKHEDFIKALGQLTPSLSKGELQKYERLRAQIEGKGARKF